jgi:hypothetical protein
MTEPVRVGQLRRWHVGEDLISPFLVVDVHRENDITYVEFLEEDRLYRFRADEVAILSEILGEAE